MQYVSINGIDSEKIEIKQIEPQGTILGPILFFSYINDLQQYYPTLILGCPRNFACFLYLRISPYVFGIA
jgi:hypothetical protein